MIKKTDGHVTYLCQKYVKFNVLAHIASFMEINNKRIIMKDFTELQIYCRSTFF